MFEIVIKNATIIDGAGIEPYKLDIAVMGGKIVKIAPNITDTANTVINATGKFVTPGFIDVHRHGDALVFKKNFGEIEVRQGITTTINGNCGLSIVPCSPEWKNDIYDYLKPITGSLPKNINFETFGEYISLVEKEKLPINFGMLVGNGTLRAAVRGFEKGSLSKTEIKKSHEYLNEAIESGAFGVSMGIAYMPENLYTHDEFIKVLEPIHSKNIPLITHIRGEGDLLLRSVKEVSAIAKELNIPLHISHFKCVGKNNWGHLLTETINFIEEKQNEGLQITCDAYPWEAGASQLVQVLPPEFLEGGLVETTKRMRDNNERAKCRAILEQKQAYFENQIFIIGFESIMISNVASKKNEQYIGKRISEIAMLQNKDPYDTVFDLLAEEECNVSMVNFIVSEKDIETILKLPYSLIISDSIFPDGGLYHPRVYGTFAKILSEFVQNKKTLTLTNAINKMTHKPAEVFGIKKRGLIAKDFYADINIFDLDKVSCNANYIHSSELSTGFDYVLVNGKIVNDHDRFIHNNCGNVLRNK